MNNLKIEKKQLGRVLGVVMTIGSLLGVIASPAMAAPGGDEGPGADTWLLEVDVSNESYCDPEVNAAYGATWSPVQTVAYDQGDNTVDYLVDTDYTVGFTVDLGFDAGSSDGCSLVADIDPAGDVYASFLPDATDAPTEPDLVMSSLDCDNPTVGCPAEDVFNTQSSLISGVLDVAADDKPGIRSGTLTVEWTLD
jgi:hypothetical protein